MKRLRAVVAANVLLAIFALALIATDWREDAHQVDVVTEIRTLSPADIEALRAQMRTTSVFGGSSSRRRRPRSFQRAVKPVQRPKPPISGPDLVATWRCHNFAASPSSCGVWASSNPGSIDQASTLGRWARSHESQVAYLGIDVGDSKREGRAFSRRYQMTFPSIWNPIEKFAVWAYVPTTLVFDRRHKLVQKIDGSASTAPVDAALRRVTRQ